MSKDRAQYVSRSYYLAFCQISFALRPNQTDLSRKTERFPSPARRKLQTVNSALGRQTRSSQTEFTIVPLDVACEADTKDRIYTKWR